jgi:hypothetical protein
LTEPGDSSINVTAESPTRILDALLTPSNTALLALTGQPVSYGSQSAANTPVPPPPATIASFTDDNPNSVPGDFTATINWGDGNTTAGTVVALGNGQFDVQGDHTYGTQGSWTATVTITDVDGGNTATAQTAITVEDRITETPYLPGIGPGPVAGPGPVGPGDPVEGGWNLGGLFGAGVDPGVLATFDPSAAAPSASVAAVGPYSAYDLGGTGLGASQVLAPALASTGPISDQGFGSDSGWAAYGQGPSSGSDQAVSPIDTLFSQPALAWNESLYGW